MDHNNEDDALDSSSGSIHSYDTTEEKRTRSASTGSGRGVEAVRGRAGTYRSLAVDEFRDGTLGDRSKSESERYRKDSRRWLWGKLAWMTSPEPEPGLAWGSSGLRPGDSPFSTSKLHRRRRRGVRTNHINAEGSGGALVGHRGERGPGRLSPDRSRVPFLPLVLCCMSFPPSLPLSLSLSLSLPSISLFNNNLKVTHPVSRLGGRRSPAGVNHRSHRKRSQVPATRRNSEASLSKQSSFPPHCVEQIPDVVLPAALLHEEETGGDDKLNGPEDWWSVDSSSKQERRVRTERV